MWKNLFCSLTQMPKSQVETYTISSHPLPPSSTPNTSRIEIPSNGNDIKIIITEPTPTEYDKSTRIHLVEANPINPKPSAAAPPTIEIVQVASPKDRTNTSPDDWILNEKTYIFDSERYTRFCS